MSVVLLEHSGMMGERTVRQSSLFHGFNLEDHVPSDHLLRSIDRFVELSDIRRRLAPYYSAMGRPFINPELMIRTLLIGYCCGIRSERGLCQEISLNLAYRWFCRLDLTDPVPDHSTFSKKAMALDPLTKEMLCLAASAAAGCAYYVASHVAAARAKGMTTVPCWSISIDNGQRCTWSRMAPCAPWVADRFHLPQNLAEALEAVFAAHAEELRAAEQAQRYATAPCARCLLTQRVGGGGRGRAWSTRSLPCRQAPPLSVRTRRCLPRGASIRAARWSLGSSSTVTGRTPLATPQAAALRARPADQRSERLKVR